MKEKNRKAERTPETHHLKERLVTTQFGPERNHTWTPYKHLLQCPFHGNIMEVMRETLAGLQQGIPLKEWMKTERNRLKVTNKREGTTGNNTCSPSFKPRFFHVFCVYVFLPVHPVHQQGLHS